MYIRSSKARKGGRRIVAEEEVKEGVVNVDSSATELVFETEDVAELIAEVTGNDVEVVADENEITFTVGETDYTIESEGDEEVLEASTRIRRRNSIKANRRVGNRPVSASRRTGRTVRRISR